MQERLKLEHGLFIHLVNTWSANLQYLSQLARAKTNSLQQVGVAASYARRYAIMGAVGITQRDEDDDADSLTEQPKALPQAKQQQQKKTKSNPD